MSRIHQNSTLLGLTDSHSGHSFTMFHHVSPLENTQERGIFNGSHRALQRRLCFWPMLWGGIRRKIRNSWYIQLSMPYWWQDKGILIDHIDHRSCSRFSWCSADMCSQCCQLWHLQKHRETWTCVPGRRGIALAILAEDFPSHTACLDLGTFTSLLVWGLVPGSLSTRRGSLRFPLDSSREWHFCTDSYMSHVSIQAKLSYC